MTLDEDARRRLNHKTHYECQLEADLATARTDIERLRALYDGLYAQACAWQAQVATLTTERDAQRVALTLCDCLDHSDGTDCTFRLSATEWQAKTEAAERRIAALCDAHEAQCLRGDAAIALLREYPPAHSHHCAVTLHKLGMRMPVCDCGLSAKVAALEGE